MGWKAQAAFSPMTMAVEVRIGRVGVPNLALVADSGVITEVEVPPGAEWPLFVSVPQEAAEVLRDALNAHAPPVSDEDLRDALEVERGRVDRLLDATIGRLTDG